MKNVRWKQRFENFSKAYKLLEDAINLDKELSILEKEGVIQRFEYTLELAWNTIKDYLGAEGVILTSFTPKSIIKQAFNLQIIENGELWIEALEQRVILANTYETIVFTNAYEKIKSRYFMLFSDLYKFFSVR